MVDEVILLDFWPSSFGMRVRIALAEKGVSYQYREENLQEKSPFLVQMNPVHKKIPVLVHNGKPICESVNIVQYIDEFWKDKSPLLPSGPYERAHSMFWANYIDKMVYPSIRGIYSGEREELEKAKKEFIGVLKVLEGELGDKCCFGGDRFGFVDLCFIPFYSMFYAMEKIGNFSIEDECPKLVAWAKRCMEKEIVAKTLPDQHKVYDFVLQLRKRYVDDYKRTKLRKR